MTHGEDADTLDKWLPLLAGKTSGQVNDEFYAWALPVRKEKVKHLYARLLNITTWKSPKKGAEAKIWEGRRSRLVGLVLDHERDRPLIEDRAVVRLASTVSRPGHARYRRGEVSHEGAE